jgi:pimeloyl-ACP methyl ester carboxylesterase
MSPHSLTKEEDQMNTVTSKDGTSIAYWKTGEGPPLLLVHGTTADHSTTWRFVLPDLEKKFTVCAMDRRGRGSSGDGPEYHLQREAEDVAAVIDAVGKSVHVLGHSYGALCAFEASLLTQNIHKMILYEGVSLNRENAYSPGFIEKLEKMLKAGETESMLITMFSELVGMPAEEIEMLRSQREAWDRRQKNATTMPRELKVDSEYTFVPERFKRMQTPTLLLVGGESPPRELENARAVADTLPNARVRVLEGQQHAAMYTVPDVFVNEVNRFLEES